MNSEQIQSNKCECECECECKSVEVSRLVELMESIKLVEGTEDGNGSTEVTEDSSEFVKVIENDDEGSEDSEDEEDDEDSEDEEDSEDTEAPKKYFKLVGHDGVPGRYVGSTPKEAACKALCNIVAKIRREQQEKRGQLCTKSARKISPNNSEEEIESENNSEEANAEEANAETNSEEANSEETSSEENEETDDLYRPKFFHARDKEGNLMGRYTGVTPTQAASKAYTNFVRNQTKEGKNCDFMVQIYVTELSKQCADGRTHEYECTRSKLNEPHEVNFGGERDGTKIVFTHRNIIKDISPNDC